MPTFTVAAGKSMGYRGRNYYAGDVIEMANTPENTALANSWAADGMGLASGFSFASKYNDKQKVFNSTGSELTVGTLVYLNGWNATNACPTVAKADADNPSTFATHVVVNAIVNNSVGYVYDVVLISGLDTSTAYAAGAPVYLSGTTGEYTFIEPNNSNQIVQLVGYVVVKDDTNGSIAFDVQDVQHTAYRTAKTQEVAEQFEDGLLTAFKLTASDAIRPHRLIAVGALGNIVEAGADSTNVIGVEAEGVERGIDEDVLVGIGKQVCIADTAIEAGVPFKSGNGGKIVRIVEGSMVGTVIVSGEGSGFSNQPANDAVSVESTSAEDVTQKVIIYGTTSGDDTNAITIEEIALTGTDAATSVKEDWGIILAVELDGVTEGDVVVKEASDGDAITTIVAGNTSAGVIVPSDRRVFNTTPDIKADAESAKRVGIIGKDVNGEDVALGIDLSGTNAITFTSALSTVDKFLVGDVAGTTSVSVILNKVDVIPMKKKGITLAAAEANEEVEVILIP
jgi:hypothetical protein